MASGAALIYDGEAAGTSILPTVAAGVKSVLGLGMNVTLFTRKSERTSTLKVLVSCSA